MAEKEKRVYFNLLNQGTISNGLELQLYLWMKEKVKGKPNLLLLKKLKERNQLASVW